MKYIKTYEKIKNKNIQVGRMYRVGNIYVSDRKLLPVVKILEINDEYFRLTAKGYFADNNEECIFILYKKYIYNIASPEEIVEFETIENSKKYNL